MNTEARVPLISDSEDPRIAELFAGGLLKPGGDILNIFRALANHPDMTRRWQVFARHVMAKNTLSPRDRELLVLRTGWNCRSRYEWGQHVMIARQCGLSDDEIEAVTHGSSDPIWSTADALLLQAADELHTSSTISDLTWANLAERWHVEQLLDIVATVGNYHLVAMFLNSLRVPLDDEVPDDPRFR